MRRLGMITTVLVFASFVAVVAKSGYKSNFNSLYGTAGKTLDTCNTCHVNGFDYNPYGADMKAEMDSGKNDSQAMQAIEGLDSDDDTYTNLQEIMAGTFPGNPTSTLPVEDSTWGKIKALYE